MPKDYLKDFRKKRKYAFDVRYDPLSIAADRRGFAVNILHEKFKKKMEHWRIENVAVKILDDLNKPLKQLIISHLNSVLIYEDPDTMEEFFDDTKRFIESIYEIYSEGLGNIKRIGVRFVSIFEFKNYSNFDEVFKRVMEIYFSPKLPLSISPIDCRAVLNHEFGQIELGPVKKDELFVKESFIKPDINVPDVGFAVDVDSFAKDIKSNNSSDLCDAFKKVFELSQATEHELVNAFIVE